MAQAAEKILELPLDEVGQLRQALATLERVRDQQRAQLIDLEQQAEVLRQRMGHDRYKEKFLRECTRDLAEVRDLIKEGDNKEALYKLERTLSYLDSAWRAS